MTGRLDEPELARLFKATVATLTDWTERLCREAELSFPEKVTAFRADMAAHGRYGQPCPRCGTAIQRIRYADNEANYCPRCQTGGKLLADRAMSRLLGADWPRTIEELEFAVCKGLAQSLIDLPAFGPNAPEFGKADLSSGTLSD